MESTIIQNLIEAMDFAKFREFARYHVGRLGYEKVTNVDGWADGGRDLSVYRIGDLNPLPVAIQTSVEKRWNAKLFEDMEKAVDKLKCHTFVYVTNRRIPDPVFRSVITRAQQKFDVHLSKMDKPILAQQVDDLGDIGWFVDFLGLPAAQPATDAVSIRREASDAFILFSNDVSNYRALMVEHAIVVTATGSEGCSREQLISKAKEAIGISHDIRNMFNSSVDRLLQRGDLVVDHSKTLYRASDEAKKKHEAAMRLVSKEYQDLRRDLSELLSRYLPKKNADLAAATDSVSKNMGNILHSYRDYQASLLRPKKDLEADIRQKYVKQLYSIRALLHQEGVPADKVDACLEELSALNINHPVVAKLTAGEVFRKLFTVSEGTLLNALGRHNSIDFYFEPSVMVPFLCAQHYKADERQSHRDGRLLYERARFFRFALWLPDLYLNECATHLIRAGQYLPIVMNTELSELRFSDNAFVAFYAAHYERSAPIKRIPFVQFLRSFGYANAGLEPGRHMERARVNLASILKSYHINIFNSFKYTRNESMRRSVEMDLSHIYHERNITKPYILVRDDNRIVQAMREKSQAGDSAQILITWDKALQAACQEDEYSWWCLDPANASDLLSLISPQAPSTMGVDVALSIDIERQKRSSRLWDALVRLERGNLNNAEIFDKAKRFKEQYLTSQTGDSFRSEQIASSWKEWKGEGDDEAIETDDSRDSG